MQSNDHKIRSLTLQCEHLDSQCLKKDEELHTAREKLRQTRIELGRVREGRKEEHAEIAELMKGAREKERDYDNKVRSGENLAAYFREKITELEREKEDLGGEYDGLKDRAAGLKEENEGWVKEVEGLRRKNLDSEGEMGGLRDVKVVLGKRDIEMELLRQDREAYRVDKVNLVRERDDAKEGKSLLATRIDTLVDENIRLQGDVETHKTTIANLGEKLQNEVKNHDLYVYHIKTERDDWHDEVNKLKRENTKLEREIKGRKRKIEEGIAIFRSKVNDGEEPSAKRPKTPQGAKDDMTVPESPREPAGVSLNTLKSPPMSSPSDTRHDRLPGNEVCISS